MLRGPLDIKLKCARPLQLAVRQHLQVCRQCHRIRRDHRTQQ
jgi:hypothetical protein